MYEEQEKKWRNKKKVEGRLCRKCRIRKPQDNFSKVTCGFSRVCDECTKIN